MPPLGMPNVPDVFDFPDKILQNIVDFCLSSERVVFPLLQEEPRRLLSQVCSKWRRVVTSTPSYWTVIDLAPTHFHNLDHARIIAQEFIERSRNLPLSFTFSTVIRRGGARQESLVDGMRDYRNLVRQILILCDSRLQSLTCTMGQGEVYKLFKNRSFPILDNIDVAVVASDTNSDGVHIFSENESFEFTAFQAAPVLRKISLRLFVSPRSINLRLPWGQLTKMHLGHSPIPVEYFIWTMNASLCLEDAFLYITFDTSSNKHRRRRHLQTTVMPNLRLLRLRLIEPRKYPSIFKMFRLPVLEELCLERGDIDTRTRRNMTVYTKLVSASQATLRRIILNEFTLPESVQSSPPHLQAQPRLVYQNVNGLLHFSQNITALQLSTGVYLNPTTLENLSTGKLLPMLDTLEICTLNGWDIVTMVERRNTICKRGISTSTSGGPFFRPLACLYLTVSAYNMDMNQRGQLEIALAGLNLAFYKLGFV